MSSVKPTLYRLLRLKPGEGWLTVSLGLLLLANALAMNISYVVSVSGFLDTGGVNAIVLVWIANYLVLFLLAGAQSLIIDRFRRVSVMNWAIIGFSIAFSLLRIMFALPVPRWLVYALLYLIAEQQWLLFPLLFWVLANDAVSVAQAKRLFPIIAAWGIVGKILGLLLAAFAPGMFANWDAASAELLTLNAVIYFIAFLIFALSVRKITLRPVHRRAEPFSKAVTEGWEFIKDVPSFRFLAIAVLLLTLSDTIIEFGFLVVSHNVFQEVAQYQTFYSLYRLTYVILALIVQLAIASRVIDRLGIKRAFFVLPAATLTGVVLMLMLPGVVTAVAAMIVLQLAGDTINEPNAKAFQGLVPEERRGRVSTFMDSYLVVIGSITGCLLLGGVLLIGSWWGTHNPYYAYLAITLLASIGAVFAIFKMRTVYDTSLLNWRLKRRQRGSNAALDKLLAE